MINTKTITIILAIISAFILFEIMTNYELTEAKQITVDVVEKNKTRIDIIADNIPQLDTIDINLPFTASDKANVKMGLGLTIKEEELLDKTLQNQSMDANDLSDYVSILIKMTADKKLSSDENKKLFGMDGQKGRNMDDTIKYLSRKKIKDL